MAVQLNLVRPSTRRPWVKINHGLIKLGRWGVCGIVWQWHGPGRPRGVDKFVNVMNKITVATSKAFNTLWKNREAVCDELANLFSRADELDFEDFQGQVADIFDRIGILVEAFPNNYFGIQCGDRGEEIAFKKAVDIFETDPAYKTVVYKQYDLDLFRITEAKRKALCQRLEDRDYEVTGRIVIESIAGAHGEPIALDWMVHRMGRMDYFITEKTLEGRGT